MRISRLVFAILIASVAASCGTPQRKVKIHSLGEKENFPVVVSYPADQRGAYFFDSNRSGKFCAEPTPDVALNSLTELAGKLKIKEQASAEASAKIDTKVVELAGRSQTVLLARELLYRACELHANGAITSDQTKEIFDSVVELISNLGKAEFARAEAERAKSYQEALEASRAIADDIFKKE